MDVGQIQKKNIDSRLPKARIDKNDTLYIDVLLDWGENTTSLF